MNPETLPTIVQVWLESSLDFAVTPSTLGGAACVEEREALTTMDAKNKADHVNLYVIISEGVVNLTIGGLSEGGVNLQYAVSVGKGLTYNMRSQ